MLIHSFEKYGGHFARHALRKVGLFVAVAEKIFGGGSMATGASQLGYNPPESTAEVWQFWNASVLISETARCDWLEFNPIFLGRIRTFLRYLEYFDYPPQ